MISRVHCHKFALPVSPLLVFKAINLKNLLCTVHGTYHDNFGLKADRRAGSHNFLSSFANHEGNLSQTFTLVGR